MESERTEVQITEPRFDELVRRATSAAALGPSSAYGEVFNCVLKCLIANEYKILRKVEILVTYEDEANTGTAEV